MDVEFVYGMLFGGSIGFILGAVVALNFLAPIM